MVFFVFFTTMLALSGCSSDGKFIYGTAHEGKMIANKAVNVYDSTGRVVSGETDSSGRYNINVEGLTEPFLLVITGDNGPLVSFVRTAGQININPITTEVVALAANTADIQGLILSPTKELLDRIRNNLDAKKTLVSASLQPVLPTSTSAEDFFINPITEGVGLDQFFDDYLLTVDATNGILLKNSATMHTLMHITVDRVELDTNARLPQAGGGPLMATPPPAIIPTDIRTVVKDKAPLIILHQSEQYFPANVDWYLRWSGAQPSLKDVQLQAKLELKKADLESYVSDKKNKSFDNIYLFKPETTDTGWFKQGIKLPVDSDPWTSYVGIAKVTVKDKNGINRNYLIARYNTFYSFNSYSNVAGAQLIRKGANYHWADWERVSIIFADLDLDKGTWAQGAVMTRAHNDPVVLTLWGDITNPLPSGDQVQIYAALQAHGTYPTKACGGYDWCADDSTKNKWNMRTQPMEYVEYSELTFNSVADLQAINNDTLPTMKNSGIPYYRSTWTDFPGPWGWHKYEQDWQDPSPWSAIEVSADELSRLGDYITSHGWD